MVTASSCFVCTIEYACGCVSARAWVRACGRGVGGGGVVVGVGRCVYYRLLFVVCFCCCCCCCLFV